MTRRDYAIWQNRLLDSGNDTLEEAVLAFQKRQQERQAIKADARRLASVMHEKGLIRYPDENGNKQPLPTK